MECGAEVIAIIIYSLVIILETACGEQKSREIYLKILTLLYRRVKGWRVETCFVINGTL
jgi:hypothetical protein